MPAKSNPTASTAVATDATSTVAVATAATISTDETARQLQLGAL
ncbi:MAG: hypothetical protein V1758_16615 [Pseudomonadota bacterium]